MKNILNVISKLRMGAQTKRRSITLPFTRFSRYLLQHLKMHNLIKGYDWDLKTERYIVYFRHWSGNVSHLSNLKLVTKPSNRNYVTYKRLITLYAKKGHVLITTPYGLFNHRTLMVHKNARTRIAGEAIAIIQF
jgi:ribosomal protein S8